MAKNPRNPPHVHAGNTQKLTESFINEMVAVEDEMEPLKERMKDLKSAAKDNGLNTKALANAVKFKRADAEKRRGMQQTAQDTDTYLTFIQLTLFPGDTPEAAVKQADKTKH